MTKQLIKTELEQVNKFIDIRIKANKQYKELERVRKELIKELNK